MMIRYIWHACIHGWVGGLFQLLLLLEHSWKQLEPLPWYAIVYTLWWVHTPWLDLAYSFNQSIGGWNTSNVVSMEAMFNVASDFNRPIGDWDTSRVKNMKEMFASRGRAVFNQPLGKWNTSQVTDMSEMFRQATSFNQNLSAWIVSPNVKQCGSFASSTPSWKLPKPSFDSCTPWHCQDPVRGDCDYSPSSFLIFISCSIIYERHHHQCT